MLFGLGTNTRLIFRAVIDKMGERPAPYLDQIGLGALGALNVRVQRGALAFDERLLLAHREARALQLVGHRATLRLGGGLK